MRGEERRGGEGGEGGGLLHENRGKLITPNEASRARATTHKRAIISRLSNTNYLRYDAAMRGVHTHTHRHAHDRQINYHVRLGAPLNVREAR